MDSKLTYSVSLGQIIDEFQLEEITPAVDRERLIHRSEVNRPGLALAGHFGYFEPGRIQIVGTSESDYISHIPDDKKAEVCLKIDRQVQQLCRKFGIEDQSWFKYMFAKSIFSCFTNLFSPSCRLSRKEKLDYIDNILSDSYVPRRCEGAAGGFAVSLLCAVVRSGWAWLNLFVFRRVALAGRLTPKLFMALKHRK